MANKSVGDDETSDQILRAERHKAESRAVKWVESLLEPGLSSDVLTEAVRTKLVDYIKHVGLIFTR